MKTQFFSILFALTFVFHISCGKNDSAQSELKNVFGNDDRSPITTGDYPWNTIGKVFGMGCTGTLVAKNLVLTAAHCVIDEETKELRDDITYFHPNYKNGSSQHKSWIEHVWWGTNDPNHSRKHDWAILRLQENLGDTYGWLGVENSNVNNFPNQLSVAGYSEDYNSGNTAGVHHDCWTKKRDTGNGFILHDCDTTRGSSGGPALRMFNDNLTIYGLNVAEYRNGGETSLHPNYYEHKYANIVIPSEGFLTKLRSLLQNQ